MKHRQLKLDKAKMPRTSFVRFSTGATQTTSDIDTHSRVVAAERDGLARAVVKMPVVDLGRGVLAERLPRHDPKLDTLNRVLVLPVLHIELLGRERDRRDDCRDGFRLFGRLRRLHKEN